MTPAILSIVTRRVNPALHHLIVPGVLLTDIGLDPIDTWGIATDLENDMGVELDWAKVDAWASVECVQASVDGVK